jgi:O-antigen/teichoic acid export membrane protein
MFTYNQKKILNSSQWLAASYICRFTIGFLSLAFVTRYLGTQNYGLLSYVISCFAFFEILLQVVNQDIIKKEIINSSNRFKLFTEIYNFQRIFNLILIAIFNILIFSINSHLTEIRYLLSVLSLSLLFRHGDAIAFYFSAEMKNDLIAKNELLVSTCFNILRIVLVLIQSPLIAFVWAIVVQKLFNFLFLKYFLNEKIFSNPLKINLKVNIQYIQTLIKQSLPLLCSAASITIFSKIDQVMLGNLLSVESVGIYAVVIKLFQPWVFIPTIFLQSLYPILVRSYNHSLKDFHQKSKKAFCILFYASIPIILITINFSDLIVVKLFSKQFLQSSPILRVHIINLTFLFWLNFTTRYEIISGIARYTMYKTIITGILNIFLNYYFIQKYGVIGASYATLVSFICVGFLLNALFTKTRKIFWLQIKSIAFWKFKWLKVLN